MNRSWLAFAFFNDVSFVQGVWLVNVNRVGPPIRLPQSLGTVPNRQTERSTEMSEANQANPVETVAAVEQKTTGDSTNPLYGVKGWLEFFVVVNMYIAPISFGISQIMAFIGFAMLAEDYPGIVVVGLIEAGVGLFLVVKWIMIARRLRDIVPGVVQEAKKWLLISLAWNVLSTPLAFMTGMDAEDMMPGNTKGLFTGVIAFAIWYSYFNVSKRVKATYPDWNK